ncbi:alpha/beta fold hydrolase [Sphingobacterium lactis]|uniref:alpha/beta fold hydrolase n=1 Tax=Sphingobacterium lactis TaxID=797291 RepID=UPI003DA2E579
MRNGKRRTLQYNIIAIICILLLLHTGAVAQVRDSLYARFEQDRETFSAFEKEHRKFAKGKHHKLAYLHWGEPSEKVFVWLPGSFLSAYDFQPFAESLTAMGYYVIAVDHYGHGLTAVPKSDLDFWDFADDLNVLLDKERIGKVVLGGFSRGGYLATAFYDRYPDRISALVLEDGGSVRFQALFNEMTEQERETFFQGVETPEYVKEKLFSQSGSAFNLYKNMLDFSEPDQGYQLFGFMKKAKGKWVGYYGLDEYMHMQDGYHYRQVLYNPDSVSRYASSMVRIDPLNTFTYLKVPLLILDATGQPDVFKSERGNQQLRELHPHLVTHHTFDCAEHNIHFECPEEFLQELLGFLDSLE